MQRGDTLQVNLIDRSVSAGIMCRRALGRISKVLDDLVCCRHECLAACVCTGSRLLCLCEKQ